MTWNYRIVKQLDRLDPADDVYAIHEVYYSNDIPTAMTVDPAHVLGESVEELKEVLELFKSAFDKPILTYPDDFPIAHVPTARVPNE